MTLLRVTCNGVELDLSKPPLTAAELCRERVYLYTPSSVRMCPPRGRSCKAKIYTRKEVLEFMRKGGKL